MRIAVWTEKLKPLRPIVSSHTIHVVEDQRKRLTIPDRRWRVEGAALVVTAGRQTHLIAILSIVFPDG